MKKLVIILACIAICAAGCKPKTTQNSIKSEVANTDMVICQSCGMPMTADLFGTNADNTLNDEYCNFCYVGGELIAPDLTMQDMINICIPYMVERGLPEGNARILLEEELPKLKRWQTQQE